MWPLVITAIGQVLDKLIPDADAANKAKAELMSMQMRGELDAILGQIKINEEEAKSASVFVAGWRPFIGWTCGFALAYVAILEPLLRFAAVVWFAYTGAFPSIDTDITLQVLLGMLGLGAMRSFDKVKGVATK